MSTYNKPEQTEQWLLDGDCSKCRRNKYCDSIRKPCKPHSAFVTRKMVKTAVEVAVDIMSDHGYKIK